MSLRARLVLGTAVIAAVLALAAVAITRTTRDHLVDQVDAQLTAAAPRLARGSPPRAETPRLSELYVGRLTAAGELVTILTPDLRGDAAPIPSLGGSDAAALRAGEIVTAESDGDARYRLIGRSNRATGVTVLGLSLADTDAALRRLAAVLVIAVLATLTVLGLVTWWVVRLGVRPVQEMTEAAAAIGQGDLSLRVPAAPPGTEAGALSAALNGMLGQIEAAFDERAAAEDRLRRFVADASHELRTPVTTIRGYAELYGRGGLSDEDDLADAMRRTGQEAVRMGALVDDLLHLARLDQGRPLERRPVDLATLARDAVQDARAVEPARAIQLDAPQPTVVLGDDARLRQVVGNLVRNALLHAPAATVTVRVLPDGDDAVLAVQDDGPGMAEDDAARAFERFYRADASRSRHQGGSGLGLAIVDAAAQAHGGTAAITSRPGAGTTVTVRLPLAPT